MTKGIKKHFLFIIAFLLFGLYFISPKKLYAQESEQQLFPGQLQGTGTHFQLTNSEYLNLTVDSNEPINLFLESVPEMVTMIIEKSAEATEAGIVLSGFKPLTTYHKYEDDYHNHIAFTTDKNGTYSYTQDLSVFHLVFIQPRSSTKFIKDDATGGDCANPLSPIGIWDSGSKTCTLITDLTETVQIDNNNIILDGNGHTIIGSLSGYGIYLRDRSGVIIRNLHIKYFNHNISIWWSSNNIIENNITEGNPGAWQMSCGINLFSSHNNQIVNNAAIYNKYYGIMAMLSNNNSFIKNNINGDGDGLRLYQVKNNIVTKNTFSNNWKGFIFQAGGIGNVDNKVYNNNFVNNTYLQIEVGGSPNNLFNLDKPTGGNYWTNYDTPAEGCLDSDSDNFCDIPHTFPGGQDNFPWTKQNGWLDQVAPTTTLSLSGTVGNNDWYRSDVQVTLTASDNPGGSGVKKTEYSFDGTNWQTYLNPFTISIEGAITVYYRSIDNLGNVEQPKTQIINIDKTPPGIIASRSPEPNSFNWNNTDVTVHFDCSDSLSGIDVCPTDEILTAEGESQSVQNQTTDKAGNTATTNVLSINIDKTSPTTSHDYGYDGLWTNADVTVALTAADPQPNSGVNLTNYCLDSEGTCDPQSGSQYQDPITITSEGTFYLRFSSLDKAGNIEPTKQIKIMLDKTAPNASINVENAQDSQCSFFFQWWIDDGQVSYDVVHGCAKISANIDASISGPQEYTLKLVDSNKNVVKQSTNSPVFYNFETSESVYSIILEVYDKAANYTTVTRMVYEDDDNDVAVLSASGGAPDLFDLCLAQIPNTDLNKDGCQDISGVNIQSTTWCIDAYTGRAGTSVYPTSSLTQIGNSFDKRGKTWYPMSSNINGGIKTNYSMNITDKQGTDKEEMHCSVDGEYLKTSSGVELTYTKKDNTKLVYKLIKGVMRVKENYHVHELSDDSKVHATMKYDEGKDLSRMHLIYNNLEKTKVCSQQAEADGATCHLSCGKDKDCRKECNQKERDAKKSCVQNNNYQVKQEFSGYKTLSLYDILKFTGYEQ